MKRKNAHLIREPQKHVTAAQLQQFVMSLGDALPLDQLEAARDHNAETCSCGFCRAIRGTVAS